jgi:hypothetical protein
MWGLSSTSALHPTMASGLKQSRRVVDLLHVGDCAKTFELPWECGVLSSAG